MEFLSALFLFSFVSCFTPGPNNIMIMSSGLNFGIKRSFPHYLGICLGFPAMILLAGMGITILFVRFPLFHQIIKIVGAIYMLYLAWQIAISHFKVNKLTRPNPLTFIQAFLFQWVNPKAWVMGMGAIAAYTTPEANLFYQVLLICITFMIVGIPSAGIWLFFGSVLKHFLTNDTHRKYFNYAMSLLLVISIALIFIE
jgi:threonine/homoserine/homoserine lactone efflux protein